MPIWIRAKIKEQARAEIARRSFIDFVTYTKDDYSVQWFHEVMAEELEQFIFGDVNKLMIFMPPQHGKSQLVSRHLPAFILGQNPKTKIVGCSYSSVLSQSFNRDIKRIIASDEYATLFPETRINAKNASTDAKGAWLNNSEIFEIVEHGGFYKNVGVGGSLTGTPADIGIIDDPVKDAAEADSLTIRARVWDWYDTVFSTRLHNASKQLLTMTRWHVDDLAGRILKKSGDDWRVLKLPAIKEKTTYHIADKRKEGEALWEEKHSAERIKKANERTYEALYQQNPVPTKGGLVYKNIVIVEGMPDGLTKIGLGMDFGYSNHPTAACVCGLDKKTNTIYVDELIYEAGLFARNIAEKLKDYKSAMIVADNDNRIIDELKKFYGFFNIRATKKGAGSILSGVALLQEYTIAITKRSKGLIFESERYTYKTDANGAPTDEPIDDFNHAWDAVRYYALSALTKADKGIFITR